jgi:hypothetical protein
MIPVDIVRVAILSRLTFSTRSCVENVKNSTDDEIIESPVI